MLQDLFTGHAFASDFFLFEVFQPVEIVSQKLKLIMQKMDTVILVIFY